MSEKISYIQTEQSSEKSFGVVFSIVFLIFALYPLVNSEGLRMWALVVSIIFFLLAFIAPKILILLNKLWFKFGLLLGSIIAPIVMAFVYFVYLPEYHRYNTRGILHKSFRKKSEVIDLVKGLNIQVIDIHQEVFVDHPDPLSLFPLRRNGHYNADGFSEIAKAIVTSVNKYERL